MTKMNEDSFKLAEKLIPRSYVKQALEITKAIENKIRILLQHRKLPEKGWSDLEIEIFLNQISAMDKNNAGRSCGVGEREGRVVSNLVAKRHYRFSHGIGRSGDLIEPQPKAAGSSLIYSLTNELLKDHMKLMGLEFVECLIVPMATGMSIVLSLLTLHSLRPKSKYVLWSRIDQKSCLKSIISAGLTPVIIDTIQEGGKLTTDMEGIKENIKQLGAENITCIISTSSCFAPRSCDKIEEIAVTCKNFDLPHLINNAYGLQSEYLMNRIKNAKRKGRVDIFVQSTDKNLLVPVGGAIISTFEKELLSKISKSYPGRASFSPVLDVFITLLSLGKNGYRKLVDKRKLIFDLLQKRLKEFAESVGEKVIVNEENPISIALTLSKVNENYLTKIGSMLFLRGLTGARVVTCKECKHIQGIYLEGWGSHTLNYPQSYLTVAAALGMEEDEVELFLEKIQKVFSKLYENEIN